MLDLAGKPLHCLNLLREACCDGSDVYIPVGKRRTSRVFNLDVNSVVYSTHKRR